MNVCGACGADFSSVEIFDRHRVGVHAHTLAEGLGLDQPRNDGRRCLAASEMEAAGRQRDGRGRSFDPGRSEGVADRFRLAA